MGQPDGSGNGAILRAAWSDAHARVHRALRMRSILPQGTALLVAISGGQDSVCLLKLLTDLGPKWNWRLQAVHCNHRWRDDAAENADFVEQLCQAWGIPCQVVTAAEAPATEAAARYWRYQVFQQLALAGNCSRVATGHTATDRAETLLYNLVRGSGADGLQALAWERPLDGTAAAIRDITVVRPLLDWTRQDTADFCHQWDLPYWQDSTNQDPGYARNRIRLEVMPQLRQYFNPQVETILAQTAELLTADVDLLEQLTQPLYDTVVQPPTPTEPWRLQRAPLGSVHLALRRRVVRRVLQRVMSAQVKFEAVEKVVALIDAPNRTQTDPLGGGLVAAVAGEWIVIRELSTKSSSGAIVSS